MPDQQLMLQESEQKDVEAVYKGPAFMKIYLAERERFSHEAALASARRQFFAPWC
ncbi:MAG: hypothetical protein RL538_128 [Candidatus Parcubacteria bacterium]|jgi:hypothetical protein